MEGGRQDQLHFSERVEIFILLLVFCDWLLYFAIKDDSLSIAVLELGWIWFVDDGGEMVKERTPIFFLFPI